MCLPFFKLIYLVFSTRMHTHTHAYTYMCTFKYTYTHTHTYICICIYSFIFAHVFNNSIHMSCVFGMVIRPRYANETGWVIESEPNYLFGPLTLGGVALGICWFKMAGHGGLNLVENGKQWCTLVDLKNDASYPGHWAPAGWRNCFHSQPGCS